MQYHSMDKTEKNKQSQSHHHYYNENVTERFDMAKAVSVISYLTIVGWLIAIALYGKHKSSSTSFHLRQSLGLIITGAILSLIPLIGWSLNFVVCVAWLFALYHSILGNQQKVPFLGDFYQEHLDFIK